ncbi:MAG TPA: trypsin-like peptidase domain-containing protein [Gaiellales bacterium]|jgi:S1-C subfamily serine protease
MSNDTNPTPPRRGILRGLTPVVGVVAVGAALAGGAVAAVVTAASDRGTRAAETVTVRDLVSRNVSSTPSSPDTPTTLAAPRGKVVQRSLEEIYRADAPGVVSVITTLKDGQAEGSGIVLDTSGYILTNQHVVADQKGVRVSFSNNDNVRAKVVGSDASTDLAVLKVDLPTAALHPLPLGDSSSVEVGDSVIAIGNPFGLDRTMTAGIVSALHRQISAPNRFTIANAIQTDAAINHGNSGGPLLDRSGAVIGINAQLPSNSEVDGNVGVGFAIPIDIAKAVIPQLEADGHAAHPWLGLDGDTIDASLANAEHVAAKAGVLIEGVAAGGPIAKAGLVGGKSAVIVNGMGYCIGGDVITAIDGAPVSSIASLQSTLASHHPGDTLTLHVVHEGGASKDYRVVLGTQPQTPTKTTSGCASP